MNNPTAPLMLIFDNIECEHEVEITPEGAVIAGEGHDLYDLLDDDQRNAVEDILQEHAAHVRDEKHYQRELAKTCWAKGEIWR